MSPRTPITIIIIKRKLKTTTTTMSTNCDGMWPHADLWSNRPAEKKKYEPKIEFRSDRTGEHSEAAANGIFGVFTCSEYDQVAGGRSYNNNTTTTTTTQLLLRCFIHSVNSLISFILYACTFLRHSYTLNCFRSHQKIELIRLIYSPHGRHYCFFSTTRHYSIASASKSVYQLNAMALLCLPGRLSSVESNVGQQIYINHPFRAQWNVYH